MNWYNRNNDRYKTSQADLYQQYQDVETGPKSIKVTGSGASEIINVVGKTISAKDLLNQVINRISPILIQNGVREINTDPISQANAAGLASSSSPGKIQIDLRKIFQQYKKALPPTTQFDGTEIDPDIANGLVKEVSQYILQEIGNISGHESQHRHDFSSMLSQNRPFSEVQEAPAKQFGKSTGKKYFPTTFRQ